RILFSFPTRRSSDLRLLNVIIREDEVVRCQGRSGFSLASAQARLASWPLCSPRRSARLTRPDSPPLRKTHLSVRGWRGTSGVVADRKSTRLNSSHLV